MQTADVALMLVVDRLQHAPVALPIAVGVDCPNLGAGETDADSVLIRPLEAAARAGRCAGTRAKTRAVPVVSNRGDDQACSWLES